MTDGSLAASCREVLEDAWDEELGYCYPHAGVYPHQWLWDSCFHVIAWAAIGDPRGPRELEGVFAAQLDNGFVPHMRYGADEMFRGPLSHASSFTQPPIYAHAARYLAERGIDPGDDAEAIIRTTRRLDLKPRGILLTHAHVDHIRAVGRLAAALGIPEPNCPYRSTRLVMTSSASRAVLPRSSPNRKRSMPVGPRSGPRFSA